LPANIDLTSHSGRPSTRDRNVRVERAATIVKEPGGAMSAEPGRSSRHSLIEEHAMAKCETCGNDYDKTIQVTAQGKTHTFDSFECAIQALAPRCVHCSVRIIGHGLEKSGRMFCCDHCATQEGVTELRDRS
jgi:hypothetical protein